MVSVKALSNEKLIRMLAIFMYRFGIREMITSSIPKMKWMSI